MSALKNKIRNEIVEEIKEKGNYTETNKRINKIFNKRRNYNMSEEEILDDIEFLIGRWFLALEEQGYNPWDYDDCIDIIDKYEYTIEDYEKLKSDIY